MAIAMEKETWLNHDDEGIIILREVNNNGSFQQLGAKSSHLGHFSCKMKLYLDVFDNLGLIHVLYQCHNPKQVQKILLKDAVFSILYLDKFKEVIKIQWMKDFYSP